MTLDDDRVPPKVAEAVLREFPLPKRRHARNYIDDRDRYLEDIAEQILIARDHLAVLEAKYQRVQAIEVEHDPDPSTRRRPGVDGRLFDAVSADTAEEWRVRDGALPRTVVDVSTGGRT